MADGDGSGVAVTDKVGVLGQASATALGTEAVYQVPSGKGAKVRIMYRGQAGSGGASVFSVAINGITVFTTAAMTASHYLWSTSLLAINTNAAVPTGASSAQTVAPYPGTPIGADYYLDANDTVTYTVSGEALQSMNFQVVGAEVDIT